jgi:hypothetical protein
VKATPSPHPLLRKSCPQDVVNILLVEIFTLATPLQVAPPPEWIGLGTFTIPFPLCQIFNEIPSHRAMDRFNLHVGVVLFCVVLSWPDTEDVGRHLSVVLVSIVLPWGNVEDVPFVFGDGDGGNHCLQVNRSGILHYVFPVRIPCVSSSGAISSIGSLVLVN